MFPNYVSAERLRLLNQNQPLKDQMAAVCTYLHFPEQHGIIKEISGRYRIPRTSLMHHIDKALGTLGQGGRYFRDKVRKLTREKRALEERLKKQEEQIEELKSELDRTKEQADERKTKLILHAAVLNNSLRDIALLVTCAFGKTISHTQISRILTTFEEKAENLMKLFSVGIETGALDEIFFRRNPILVIVEALSHAIVAIEKKASRSGEDWVSVIEKLPFLNTSVNDKGSGILSGLEAKKIPYQVDVFHILQEAQKAFRKLERKTYAFITQIDDLKQKLSRLRPYRSNRGKKMALMRKCRETEEVFNQAAGVYDLVEWILKEIRISFGWFQPSGRLNTSGVLRTNLGILSSWLEELSPGMFHAFIRYVNSPSVATFLDRLHEKLSAIDTANPWGLPHETIVEHVGRLYLAAESKNPMLRVKQILLERVLGQWEGYENVKEKIMSAFETTHRSSASVENVNTRLRLYEQVKKHVDQCFLNLAAVYHNLAPFKDGAKREGKSPAELLGVKLPSLDFFEALGLSPT